ncbi:MAG: hypothetical protein AAF416_11340 [Pseudomonadota bacterium]
MAKSSDIWISLWNDDPDQYSLPIHYDNTGREPKLGEKCRKAIPLESEDVPEHLFHSGQRRLHLPLKEANTITNGVPIVRRDWRNC